MRHIAPWRVYSNTQMEAAGLETRHGSIGVLNFPELINLKCDNVRIGTYPAEKKVLNVQHVCLSVQRYRK